MSSVQNSPLSSVPLESVLITDELVRREARHPDNEGLNRCLIKLAQTLATAPDRVLQALVETALDLCRAHSSGLSILEEENGKEIFRWHGVAGQYASHLWGTTPRDFSPCGTVLDTDAVQLMSHLDRHFGYFAEVKPHIVEALLVPFYVGGKAVGTVWVISHDQDRKFDAEDKRALLTLGEFASAAYQVVFSLKTLSEARVAQEEANRELLRRNKAFREQLRARKRAEAALSRSNSDLEQFTAAVSHDLREPLRTVAVYSELLQRQIQETLDPEAAKLLSTIRGGASRMQRLVDDLLEFSRFSGGNISIIAPVDFQDALNGALQNLRALVEQNNAVITHDILPAISGDKTQLVLLLQNLLGNSIKYRRPDEDPRIHLSVRRGQDHWEFSLEDNGQGFAPEYSKQIFGIFQRLHSQKIEGTGIGLALCKKIVEQHGGTIWATSAPGKGSVFSFTLPIVEDQAPLRVKRT